MYIATIPNRSSPPAILLRESYRAGGKVQPAGEARRGSVVAPAQRSARATRKATQKTADEQPVHSFQTLLADLATLAKNRVRFGGSEAATLTIYTQPTPLQQRPLALLQINL